MLGDQSYRYLTADEMKSLGDDSLPIDVTKDEKQQDAVQAVKQFVGMIFLSFLIFSVPVQNDLKGIFM